MSNNDNFIKIMVFKQVTEFFREEELGVLVTGTGETAVALFRTPHGKTFFAHFQTS